MDYVQIMNELKTKSDSEVKKLAASYGIDLSIAEIKALRPLVDEVSFHWLFTGIPESFIAKVRKAIGDKKTEKFLRQYFER